MHKQPKGTQKSMVTWCVDHLSTLTAPLQPTSNVSTSSRVPMFIQKLAQVKQGDCCFKNLHFITWYNFPLTDTVDLGALGGNKASQENGEKQ